jgi:hypothetical protein
MNKTSNSEVLMEAASLLTSLGGENEAEEKDPESGSNGEATSPKTEPQGATEPEQKLTAEESEADDDGPDSKRYLPDHKKPDAALTFPEKVSFDLLRLLDRNVVNVLQIGHGRFHGLLIDFSTRST